MFSSFLFLTLSMNFWKILKNYLVRIETSFCTSIQCHHFKKVSWQNRLHEQLLSISISPISFPRKLSDSLWAPAEVGQGEGIKQEDGKGPFHSALVLTFPCGGRCVQERKRRFLLPNIQVKLSTDSRSCQTTNYICSYLVVLHVTRENQIYLFIFSQGPNSAQ